ncbi:MAG: hypothetical protein ACE5WD_00725 [Candidatus Aminicenantia bacterium]
MKIKKILILSLSFILTSSLLFSQDLVEIAKKEKERRAKLKSEKTKVITNSNLADYRGKEAIIVQRFSEASTSLRETYFPEKKKSVREVSPLSMSNQLRKKEEQFWKDRKAEYKNRWKKTKEFVDLLTTRMNGLWQEYYSMDDMTSRDKIQMEISQTYQKLLQAQKEEARAKEELEKFLIQAKKEGALPGWLRDKD